VKLRANGAVVVDEAFRSSVPSIHALGDASSPLQLTPVALAEAMTFVDHGWGEKTSSMSYDNVPTAVFSLPNVGSVGLSEEAARQKFAQVEIYRSEFRPLRAMLSGRQEKTFMKLVVDVATDRVLGAHMVGRDAGETIQGVAIALKAGATKAQFDATIGIHPTVAEEFVTMRDKVH
jgi:glutathione reductase (NADPH)